MDQQERDREKIMRDDLHFQNYLVIYLDHLGQGERLRKITGIPTTDEKRQIFIENITESFGRVRYIRDNFRTYFELWKSSKYDIDAVSIEHQSTLLMALKNPKLILYGLSNAVVIAVPLMSNDESESCTAMNGVRSALLAVCQLALLAFSSKIPIRAGIDIGIAAEFSPNEIYGSALLSAYDIESKLAEYPRFLIGKELINYLFWVENKRYDAQLGSIAQAGAKFCQRLIIQDTDGRFMLDFLGNVIKEVSGDSLHKEDFISALEFVTSQYEKYLKEDNELLASRYYRLLRYFNSRKSIWEVS